MKTLLILSFTKIITLYGNLKISITIFLTNSRHIICFDWLFGKQGSKACK